MKALALLALLALPAAAKPAPKTLTAAPESPKRTPCECAANPRCWGIAMAGFAQKAGIAKTEVEGALPGRFFPAAWTFALRKPTTDGHFLLVQCGPERRPCEDKRDELERRLIVSRFVTSLPLYEPEETLADPVSWVPTDRGEAVWAEVKQCRKGFLEEVAVVVLGKR